MKLFELMNILDDGTAYFTILPYCEEYGRGISQLKEEPWYKEIESMEVLRVVTIGGGMYKVEICIEIQESIVEDGETEYIPKRKTLEIINSYGGADATEKADKQSDDIVRAIYYEIDGMEPIILRAGDGE